MSNVSYPITIINSTINITGENSVGTVIVTHDLSTLIDGQRTAFPLSPAPDLSNVFVVTLDGLVLTPNQDYTLANNTLTLNFAAPQLGAKLLAFYQDL